MRPDTKKLIADIEALHARCEEAIDWLAQETDRDLARSAGSATSGVPIGNVRQSLVRGEHVFDAAKRLFKEN
jgi:hypothetical protein